MKKILSFTILFTILFSNNSFAEEIVIQPEDQRSENQNVYSVVDENGVVQNNIVCSDSVCGSDGQFNGAMPQDTPWAGMKLVKQGTGNVGGHWGTYNSNTETFTIDRSCATCAPHADMHKPGTIKDGVITYPIIIPGLDEFVLNNPDLTIDEAADLLKDLLQQEVDAYYEAMKSSFVAKGMSKIVIKKNKFRTIKLTPNLKQFKKLSKTKKVCTVKGNSVLILKSGICKIDIYKDGQKEKVVTKVKK